MTSRVPVPDLAHASHVRLAYRALLGREPSADEIRIQLAGLRTTDELLRVLTASPEFTGTAQALLPPPQPRYLANTWHPDLAELGHPVGSRSIDEVAIMGDRGWIFLDRGSNAVLSQFTGEIELSEEWEQRWLTLLTRRSQEAQAAGLALASLVVPDKLAVVGHHFPGGLASDTRRPVERLIDRGADLLYPVDALRGLGGGDEAYLRTDSHCSLAGNAELAKVVARQLGLTVTFDDLLLGHESYVSAGDLGVKFEPPVVERIPTLASMGSAEIIEDNRDEVAAHGGHVGSRRVFRNQRAQDPRTVVVFGDSYGFGSVGYEGLTWFLAQVFRETHFVWVPFGWDAGYLREAGAGAVVSQTAERFMIRVPATTVDVRSLTARARTGAVGPDAAFADQDTPDGATAA